MASDAVAGAVNKAIPGIIKGLARRGVDAVLGDAQERALVEVCGRAVQRAVAEAALAPQDPVWLEELAKGLAETLDDPARVDGLIRASLGELSAEAEERWRAEFLRALSEGRDVELLGRTVDVGRMLDAFSAALWDELSAAAVTDGSPLASLWTHTVLSRILGRLDAGHLPRLPAAEVRDRLADYLRQVEARAGERPSLVPERLDVEGLHQRVRIRTRMLRAGRQPGEQPTDCAYLPKGAHEADDAATIEWWTAVRDRHQRLVVLGEPGYGKTWLLRHEARRLAVAGAARLDGGEHPEQVHMPVWLRLDELAATLPADATREQLPEALVRALRSHHRLSPGLAQWLEQRIAAGACVLLLDAWDEVADRHRALTGALSGWARAHGDGRVILTSRLAGYTGSPVDAPGTAQVELVPFSPEDVERFVDAWFAAQPAAASRLRAWLRHNPAAAGMSRVPLLLTLLCALSSDPGEELPARRTKLCERILRRFLAREHRPLERRPGDLEVDATLEVLGFMAVAFANRDGAWVDRMPADGLVTAIRAAGDAYRELQSAGRGAYDILAALSKEDGVLVPAGDPTGGRSVPYLFLHRTFHEYLVARHLSRQPTEGWMPVVQAHRWFEPEWDEVIAMLAGLLPDPDPLLRALADCTDDPFHASLLHAARAVAELPPHRACDGYPTRVIDRLLGLLGGPDPERGAGIRALNRLVRAGNPHAIAALIARLDHPDAAIWVVTRALQGTTDPQATAALTARLDHPDAAVRWAAAGALQGTTDPQATAALTARLDHPNAAVRWTAVCALRGTTDPQATAALTARLDHPNAAVRWAAVCALRGTTDPQATALLIARLDDPDADVRWAAAEALQDTTNPRATAALSARLDYPNALVQRPTAQALRGTTDPQATAELAARLDHPNAAVRWTAVYALRGTTDPQATAALTARLDHPNASVRWTAVYALRGTTDPQATAELAARLDSDPEADVRQAAQASLTVVEEPHGARERCACLLDRWRQASNQLRRHLYAALAALAPKAYHAVPPAERPAWRAAMAEVTRTVPR